MTSSCISKSPLLEVEGLNLVFRTSLHRAWNWRDVFTRMARWQRARSQGSQELLQIAKNISFRVDAGDRVALIGVNGAGKTSLCRCIAGFYAPTSGVIRHAGKVRAVFDTTLGAYPELTGRENLKILAQLMYPDEEDTTEICEESAVFSELGEFLDMPFRLYSNGMQARLCLSLISARPAELLILDEVFDGADRFFREKISRRILSMIQKSGAVIFVSHSTAQIEQVCNRLVLLKEGQIAYDGPVSEGLELYTSSFGTA
jgi:ABC-type polysaccharide/polyol phosphate transport system ATPase subunit